MSDPDLDWLGDMRWHGYPRLEPVRDLGAAAPSAEPAPAAPRRVPAPLVEPRAAELERENETLRQRLAELTRLAEEFDRRLAEAGASYEAAVLESDSGRRDAEHAVKRLTGELKTAQGEAARLTARDALREADLRLERERRSDSEKALSEARRRLEELTADSEALRARAFEQAGAMEELRRQAGSQNERLLQAKVLTDQDIALLRQELRDFIAKFHRIQESLGENE